MDKQYGVFNTALGTFVQFQDGVLFDARTAKARARCWNAAMKPEHQSYTVATIIFDPEV